MEYYSAVRQGLPIHATTWMNQSHRCFVGGKNDLDTVRTISVYLNEVQEQTKLIYVYRSQIVVYLWGPIDWEEAGGNSRVKVVFYA